MLLRPKPEPMRAAAQGLFDSGERQEFQRPVECRGRARVAEGARVGVLREMVIASRVTRSGIMPDIGSLAREGARRAPMDEIREIRIGGRVEVMSQALSDYGGGWAGG